jgi:hypothetical protein
MSTTPSVEIGVACSRCLRRQPGGRTCEGCGSDSVFDLRSRRERAFIEEAEDRARDARNRRIHTIAVLGSMLIGAPIAAVIFFFAPVLLAGDGMTPHARANLMKPLFVVMVVVLVGPALLLEKLLERKRTSILDGLPDPDRP